LPHGIENVGLLVLDLGSYAIKLGFACDDAPRITFPSIVGRPKYPSAFPAQQSSSCYFGNDALNNRGILTLKYPIEHGIVTNWDDMTEILE
jgi:actin